GEYNVKAGYYGRKPKAKLTPELMAFPLIESGEYSIQFSFTDPDGVPYSNTKYIAYFADGMQAEGVTNEQGNTEVFNRDDDKEIEVKLFHPDFDTCWGGVSSE
ncbi:TPA: hypothetical protein J1179_003771, partial [Escherichia coli]|nr:hypothetical protein [Escherichia coli]